MLRKTFIAAMVLVALPAPVAAQSVKAGIEAWQRSDYSTAVAIWRPLAEKGDADAQFNLAQAYRLGRGVPANIAVAKTWLERAAGHGHVDAQTTLGLLLFQNGEQANGLKWLKAAAEQGEARALLVYGTALYNGDGVTQDPVLGYAYISRAAAQGLGPARDSLAQLDKLMPVAARKKGVALARAKAKAAPPPGPKLAPKTKPVPVAAAAKPGPAPKVAAIATRGAWRIQLGAFAQRGSAEALYRKLSGTLPGRQAYYIPVGAITRLQVGPFTSKASAGAACAGLKGQACFVVPAR